MNRLLWFLSRRNVARRRICQATSQSNKVERVRSLLLGFVWLLAFERGKDPLVSLVVTSTSQKHINDFFSFFHPAIWGILLEYAY